jgi:hypothetical protein
MTMGEPDRTGNEVAGAKDAEAGTSACGPGCGCEAGSSGRLCWVAWAVIAVVAAVAVAQAIMRSEGGSLRESGPAAGFAPAARKADTPAAAAPSRLPGIASGMSMPDVASPEAATKDGADAQPSASVADTTVATAPSQPPGAVTQMPAQAAVSTEAATKDSPEPRPSASAGKPDDGPVVCGEGLRSLNDLNRKAMDKDGVFVLLAGPDAGKAREAAAVVERTAALIRERGISIGLFTLEENSREYEELAGQVPPPGVIAMVKGRGASAVSGGITESRLMQAFAAASSSGGCCGASGCGSGGGR